MVLGNFIGNAKRFALGHRHAAPEEQLFPKTDPAVDGDACTHDCESCNVKYPKGFKIDESDELYGLVNAWSTHLLVATGKTDWVRDVEDEKGSVMEAFGNARKPANGNLKLSASNMPTPDETPDYDQPTSVLLLPALTVIENVTPESVPSLIIDYVDKAPTTTTPLNPANDGGAPAEPASNGSNGKEITSAPAPTSIPSQLTSRPCPHSVLILLCSQRTRDARCGQSAPLIRKELERHLRPLGLYRDLDDERPGGVGIYFISHVGGHKYSANVMIYRRADPFGLDEVQRAEEEKKQGNGVLMPRKPSPGTKQGLEGQEAAQCIWLARVMPEDCENIVRYTVLQGKVVKPGTQLRGGFDRAKGLMSW